MNMTSTAKNIDGGDSSEEEIGRLLSMKESNWFPFFACSIY